MFLRVSSCCLALALLFSVTPSHATGPDELIARAEKFYEQLEYEKALKILIDVIQHKDADEAQQARAYLYMGVCFTALGSQENAVRAFAEVLRLRPNFRMPGGVSPSIRANFDQALQSLGMSATPPPGGAPGGAMAGTVVTSKAPFEIEAGKPIDIEIRVDDPQGEITGFVVRWRRTDATDFSSINVERPASANQVTATISGATTGEDEGALLYYVQAVAADGTLLGSSGTEGNPKEIKLLEGEDEDAVVWWTIGIIGGVTLVAAIVATAIALSSGDGQAPNTADVVVTVQ